MVALRPIDGGPGYFAQFTNSLPSDPNYFPIGVWYESVLSQSDIDLDKDVGLNLYVVLTNNSDLSLIHSNGMHVILQWQGWNTNQAANSPAVAGWALWDEIDMQQGPGQGYTTLDNVLADLPNDGRFRYNNYGKGVMFWEDDPQAAQFINQYQHVTSNDIYWFTDPNVSGWSEGGRFLLGQDIDLTPSQTRLAANYGYTVDRMRELDAMDGAPRPVWNFVEVGSPFGGRTIEPEEIKAAVWHSIIAGARGIIYFNHSFGGPNPTQHALRDPAYAAQRAAVDSTDALIEQLAPVLNAPFDDAFVTASPSVRAMAKFYENVHYVFAGSTQPVASTATFTLPSVTSGTATVINEGRTIPIVSGQFFDNFANGNAFHIYQISTSFTPSPGAPTIASLNDVTISEGDSGTKVATFTVTRSGGTVAFDVNFATSNGTATVADSDYGSASNTLHFGANETTKTISVTINGDTKVEANETFNVVLSNATNGATISDSQGVGTITNDDAVAAIAGSVSINDVTISEGDSGTKVATFTVTRSGGTVAFDVNFATSNGTATVADSDYGSASNTLHFGANETTKTISVTINGDTKVEANETFNVVLSNATNGATISDSQGVGTITNDDAVAAIAGSVSINDVTISEGDSGTKVATFTVTRSGGTVAFDVNFATSNGTATVADSDYGSASNTLHFGANETTKTISVTINGDTKVEANETFNVVLSNATNGATISDSQGVGTITNDDGAPTSNLVVNGGFENEEDFSGWTLSGNSSGNQIHIAPTVSPGEVHTGSYSAGLGSFSRTDGILTQNVATTAGQHYTLSFWIASDNNQSTPINHFAAKWNGQTLMDVTDAPNSGYQLYTFDVVGIDGDSVLEFDAYNSPDAWRLDDVMLTAGGVAIAGSALTLDGDPAPGSHAPVLTEAALQHVIDSAIVYWAQHGADAGQLAMLKENQVQISDLGGRELAHTDAANVVTIDDDAAGYSWSVGLSEVNPQSIDLLSAVAHEFGHVLGYDHQVMDNDLAVGERQMPLDDEQREICLPAGDSDPAWSQFTGQVSGFTAQDLLDLADIAFGSNTTIGYAANSNNTGGTLSDGASTPNIALLGQYTAASFVMPADGFGGTLISDPPPATLTQTLTQPQHA